jgi:aspartate racemase
MRTLGLLGGMTYNATSVYYNAINKIVQQRLGGASSANLLLHSFNHAEMQDLFTAKDWSTVIKKFVSAGNNMKAAGAGSIMICCNIGHKVADEVEKQVGLPLLHIADYTGTLVKKAGIKKVALLATKPVMEDDFFKERLKQKYGLDIVVPEKEQRDELHKLIFGDLGAGIFNQDGKKLLKDMVQRTLDRGAEGVIFACTELQFLVKSEDLSVPLWDTAAAHAVGAAEWALTDG